ncbi:MAG: efflux RND transporter periplasmic adaptor subunit [Bacteroidetes bacterium]|nr:efflux RND transporter periplasmic adaptor subunit [Bacteroidota bacterium]
MKTSFYQLLMLPVFLVGFNACTKSDAQEIQNQDELVPVKVSQVVADTLRPLVVVSGPIRSDSEAALSFKTGGIIREILVSEGDHFTAGQSLATLDLTEISALVAQATIAVGKAERDFNRVSALYQENAATLEQLQNVTTALELAKRDLTIAGFNESFSVIRAPYSGQIVRKLMNKGEMAGPGIPVLLTTSTNKSDWVIKASVSDKDWAILQPGQQAVVFLDAWPEVRFEGEVVRKAAGSDPVTGRFPVDVRIRTNHLTPAPGMFATAEIRPVISRQPVTRIPLGAIVEGNGKKAFVYVPLSDGRRVKKVPVTLSQLDNEFAWVANGLSGISEVVSAGSPFLTESSFISIIQ